MPNLPLLAPSLGDIPLMDVDVLLGHYPFRQFPRSGTDPQQIKAYLQSYGITRACISSLHAIFYTDPQQGNDEVFPLVTGDDFFHFVGTINPSLHNWSETLARCVDEYGCRMVRLVPNYHMYSLSDRFVDAFLEEAQRRELVVCIAKRVEDERMHHLLMKVPAVDTSAIAALARRYPHPLLILSAYFGEIQELSVAGDNLYFDIAFAETINTMQRLAKLVPPNRLLLGTHTPFSMPKPPSIS